MKKLFGQWSLFEKLWLLLFTSVNVYLFFAWDDTVIGLIASLTGMLCVVLVAKGKISNYFFGLINASLYAYLAYHQGLMGEFQLNAFFYIPMQFIGFYLWHRSSRTEEIGTAKTVRVKVFTLKTWIITCSATVMGILTYGTYLEASGGSQAYLDATTTVLSIVAQVLMVKRFAEQWLVWIVINILSIVLWAKAYMLTGNDVTILVMWSAYLVNSIYGYINWRNLYKEELEEE